MKERKEIEQKDEVKKKIDKKFEENENKELKLLRNAPEKAKAKPKVDLSNLD